MTSNGLITHVVGTASVLNTNAYRDSIAGYPCLPAGTAVPQCGCGERMVVFLQFDIRPEFGLPGNFVGGHFLAFACPNCGGITDLHMQGTGRLPDAYWEQVRRGGDDVGFAFMLVDAAEPTTDFETRLEHRILTFERTEESLSIDDGDLDVVQPVDGFPGTSQRPFEGVRGIDGFKIGGQPCFGDPIDPVVCSCGSKLVHLVSIPEGGAPFVETVRLPCDGFLLQNYVSVFACEQRCHPGALFPMI